VAVLYHRVKTASLDMGRLTQRPAPFPLSFFRARTSLGTSAASSSCRPIGRGAPSLFKIGPAQLFFLITNFLFFPFPRDDPSFLFPLLDETRFLKPPPLVVRGVTPLSLPPWEIEVLSARSLPVSSFFLSEPNEAVLRYGRSRRPPVFDPDDYKRFVSERRFPAPRVLSEEWSV